MSDLKIAVLGCGIVGSTTAIELKNEFRNASVHIISEKFQNETTSYVAAGIFSPEGGNLAGDSARTRKWLFDAYNYWDKLRLSSDSELSGVRHLSGYILSRQHAHIVKNPMLEELLPLYRAVKEDELEMFPGDWKYGSYLTTLQTDPTRYLKWTANIIENIDIKVVKRKISSFDELSGDFDIVVNCTGIGAKYLCDDTFLVPLRGQVSIMKAPWVKEFVFGEWDTYIVPTFDSVTLGGCRQYESYETAVNRYDALAMEERCINIIPSLRNAHLVEHRVGLRPFRAPARVEKDFKLVGSKLLKIVHNYGHGGQGITFSPGTSLNAVQLVREIITEGKNKL